MKSLVIILVLFFILSWATLCRATLRCEYYDGDNFVKPVRPVEGSLKGPNGCYLDVWIAGVQNSKSFLGYLFAERSDGCFYHFENEDPEGFTGNLICGNY